LVEGREKKREREREPNAICRNYGYISDFFFTRHAVNDSYLANVRNTQNKQTIRKKVISNVRTTPNHHEKRVNDENFV